MYVIHYTLYLDNTGSFHLTVPQMCYCIVKAVRVQSANVEERQDSGLCYCYVNLTNPELNFKLLQDYFRNKDQVEACARLNRAHKLCCKALPPSNISTKSTPDIGGSNP